MLVTPGRRPRQERDRPRRGLEMSATLLGALAALSTRLSSLRKAGEVLTALAAEAARLLHTDSVAIRTVDGDELVIAAASSAAVDLPIQPRTKIGETLAGRIVRENRVVAVDDPYQLRLPIPEQDRAALAAMFGSFLGVPICSGNRVMGTLEVYAKRQRSFSPDDVALLSVLADRAALALQNASLHGTLEERAARVRTLASLNKIISSSLDSARVLRAIATAARDLMRARLVMFWRADETARTLTLFAFSDDDPIASGYPVRSIPYGRGGAGMVAESRCLLNVPDMCTDERMFARDWWKARGLRSLLAVPIVLDDSLLAVLTLCGETPFSLDAGDEELLATFVDQAAITLRNAQLFEGSEQRRRVAEGLADLGRALTQAQAVEIIGQQVIESVCRLFDPDAAGLYHRAPDANDLVLLAAAGAGCQAVLSGLTAAARRTIDEGRPVVTQYATAEVPDEPIANAPEEPTRSVSWTVLGLPLMTHDRVIGALAVGDDAGREFEDTAVQLLQTIADQAALAIEKRRLYDDAQQAMRNLQAKNADLDSFVYVVSHDLKSPLVTIQGMTGMLIQDQMERLDERGRRYLQRISANVEQMERLIGDLLALSRVGREGRPAELVAMKEVVDEVLMELGERLQARGVKVTCGALGSVVAIRTQMFQVWSNLLSNAVKYMGDVAEPTVEVGCADRGEFLEYWVRDNGIGIDPAYHGQVFEMFQRLKEVEAEGTGVGLSIVKKIVEAAGGRARVESAKGQGSTFYVAWPKSATVGHAGAGNR